MVNIKRALQTAQREEVLEKRERLLTKILSAYPSNVAAKRLLKELYSQPHQLPDQLIIKFEHQYRKGSLNELEHELIQYKNIYGRDPRFSRIMGLTLVAQGNTEMAIKCFAQEVKLAPQSEDALFNLANAYQTNGNYSKAVATFDRVLERKANHLGALNNKALALIELERFEEARLLLLEASKLDPKQVSVWVNLGMTYSRLDRLDQSITAFEKAIDINRSTAEAYLNLIETLEKWNKLRAAAEWLEKAQQCLPHNPDLVFWEARLLYRNKKHQAALHLLKQIDPDIISSGRKASFFEIRGKVLDETNLADAAFENFTSMNGLLRQEADRRRIDSQSYVTRYVDQLSRLKSTKDLPPPQTSGKSAQSSYLTPVFMIGFPRSGSTLLDHMLSKDSRISVLEEKNLIASVKHHFSITSELEPFHSYQLRLNSQLFYQEQVERILERKLRDNEVLIDKHPLNLLELPFIKALFPNAKFIVNIRHPLGSVFSCWMQNFDLNPAMANMLDLDDITILYDTAFATLTETDRLMGLTCFYVRYEDLIASSEEVLTSTKNYLGLFSNHASESDNLRRSKVKRINTPSYSQVSDVLYTKALERWKNYLHYLEPQKQQLNRWIEHFGYVDDA